MFKSLIQHVNNQTICRVALEKLKKIWICLVFVLLQYFLYNWYFKLSPKCFWNALMKIEVENPILKAHGNKNILPCHIRLDFCPTLNK